jgi:hypothetical protein
MFSSLLALLCDLGTRRKNADADATCLKRLCVPCWRHIGFGGFARHEQSSLCTLNGQDEISLSSSALPLSRSSGAFIALMIQKLFQPAGVWPQVSSRFISNTQDGPSIIMTDLRASFASR